MCKPAPMPQDATQPQKVPHKATSSLDYYAAPHDFDKIAEHAKTLFRVPLALLSLVDSERQWFKARCGVDLSQASHNIPFCTHTILSFDVMVVLDAQKDVRFKDSPLVTGSTHIRFYAGAPIIVPDGLVLGTLCIIDTVPRDAFSHDEIAQLTSLAEAASTLIQKKAGL